jgi:tetratricopeptide (TPR) repeat protein
VLRERRKSKTSRARGVQENKRLPLMIESKKIFLKRILPLLAAFIGTFIFFAIYNNYLIDKTLANLKISLQKLEEIKDPAIADTVSSILDDTFILEVVQEELDVNCLARIELSSQIISGSAEGADERPIEDALSFLQKIVEDREKKRTPFINALETVLVNLNPEERTERVEAIKRNIDSLSKDLDRHEGAQLQEKHLEIARLYVLCREWAKALDYLARIEEIDPTTIFAKKARFYSGIVYKFMGEYEKAVAFFNQVKDELPEELGAFSSFEQGDALLRMGKTDEAISVFQQRFHENPHLEINQISQFRAAYLKLGQLQDPERLAEVFEKGPTIDKDMLGRLTTGEIVKIYDLEEEEEVYEMFESITKRIEGSKLAGDITRTYRNRGFDFAKKGYSLLRQGKYDEAVKRFVFSHEQFNLALGIEPRDAFSHSGKGLALYYLDRHDTALAETRRAKELSPQDPIISANLGFVYGELRMFDKAIAEYQQALKDLSDSAVLNYNLGTFYLLKGELAESKTYFTKAREIDPQLPNVYNNLGYIYWRQKRIKEAKTEFERGVSLRKDYAESHYNLGIILFSLKKYEEARREFELVKKLRPKYRKTDWFLEQIKEEQLR